MKIYTEKQVREILKKAFWQDFNDGDTEDSLINELTPIELPTDDEILQEAYSQRTMVFSFTDGAKWMRDTIKGGNK